MSTNGESIVFKRKDSADTIYSMYPITTMDNVAGLAEALAANAGIPIITATSTDGVTYIATVPGMDSLVVGKEFIIIPDMTSTVVNPKLNVNELGDKYLRCPIGTNNATTTTGANESWIYSGKPLSVRYNGTFWITDVFRADANNLYGIVSVEKGGTGASAAEQALVNLGAASQVDLDQLSAEIGDIDAVLDEFGVNPDCHAEYFTVTDDGVVALKPEYRGATTRTDCPYAVSDMGRGTVGSKNAEIPKRLVIPEIVDGKAVSSLAVGAFLENMMVESVTLPNTVTEIPDRCFDTANHLKNIYNTENIVKIGKCAFQFTSVVRVRCPNLSQFSGIGAFNYSRRLVYADVGNVVELPQHTFNCCTGLNMVKNKADITSVGANCFSLTPSLRQARFIPNLKSIGNAGFLCSGIEYDWSTLTNCTFGTDATLLQYNPTDFWSACSFAPCENPLPTFLTQSDSRWVNRQIGNSGKRYGADGCILMSILHIYCALHNLTLSTVMEFEQIVNGINPTLLNSFQTTVSGCKSFAEGVGLKVEQYSTSNQTTMQNLYDALSDGKYCVVFLSGKTTSLNHVVVAYGVNDKGELLVADSNSYKDDDSEPIMYSAHWHKLSALGGSAGAVLNIISL